MLKLPKVPYTMDKDQAVAIPFRGINFSDRLSDGDIADSFGISMRRYPFVTNKRGRKYQEQEGLKGITHYDGSFVYVKEGALYYDQLELSGEEGSEVKSFATINSKVVMMPGKKYIEFAGGEHAVCDLEEEIRVADVVFRSNAIDAGYSALKSLPGGWFDAETKSFRKLGTKTMTCTSPMYVGNSTIEPVYKLISNANKQDHIFIFGDKGEFNTLKGLDLTGIRLAVVSTPDNQLSFCGTITAECEKNGEDEYRLVTSENINVDNEKKYDIYAFGVKKSNKFFDYLKVGDKFKIGTDSYIVADLSEDHIETEEEMDEGEFFEKLVLDLTVASASFSARGLNPGDTIKFEESSNNTDTYTIKEVQDHKLIFVDDEVIVNEEIPNTVRVVIWESRDKKVFSKLKEGDAVTVSGCSEEFEDNNRTFVIDKIDGGSIYAAADIFKAGNETNELTISRKVPELDFICEAENRLWGCNSSENTIYISALGDPTNMYAYEGLSTDSFATAVGSPGDFTGCCRYSSSVLFFKEDKIHKILGTCPADYTLYSYDVEGIQKGSDNSAVVINEVLYYKGTHGIYAYDGGIPTLISDCFGDKLFYDAVAGTDGVSYYVSMHDAENKWYLFAYNTQTGIWTLEDKGFGAKDAVRVGMDLYFLDNAGVLWKENAVEDVSESEWMIQFTPFYETIQGKKIYSRLLLRAELPKGSYMVVEIRCDGGRWMELGKIVGKSEGVVPVRIPVNRCDKFEIRLRGKGEFLLREMLREYYVSSEK